MQDEELYRDLVRWLAKADPMGLVHHGAPEDEYDIEAKVILAQLPTAGSPEEVATIIDETFVKYFNTTFSPGTVKKFRQLGEKVWVRSLP